MGNNHQHLACFGFTCRYRGATTSKWKWKARHSFFGWRLVRRLFRFGDGVLECVDFFRHIAILQTTHRFGIRYPSEPRNKNHR